LFREIYRSVRRHRTRQCRELLRVANWLPPKHPLIAEIITPWTEQVKEATKGRVMMQVLPSPVGPPPALTSRLVALLEGIGKVPVVCKASPGFIVPRLQALAMNEAARLLEEGVASPEDIDKATRFGFGFRFAVLGVLAFIDWGGGDILYHASRYLKEATGSDRFAAPRIVEDNMAAGRNGLRERAGFLDYAGLDLDAYRRQRLAAFVALLKHMGIARPPVA
jgi:3-hydroxybutyryl-CoA dehydrogenase